MTKDELAKSLADMVNKRKGRYFNDVEVKGLIEELMSFLGDGKVIVLGKGMIVLGEEELYGILVDINGRYRNWEDLAKKIAKKAKEK